MPDLNVPALIIAFLVLIFSLSVHEAAHVDPIGSLLLPLIAMVSGAPLIGWAKPTPVNTRNLSNPRRDHILVTAAGPISNLLIAIAASAALRAGATPGSDWLGLVVFEALTLNVLLAVFNMLPIPPLDGGQILMALLPPRIAMQFGFLYEYGFLILMGLLVTGVLSYLIGPPYYVILSWLQ